MTDMLRDAPEGYTLGKRFQTGRHSEVYEAVRDDGLDVVIKAYVRAHDSQHVTRAQREHDVLRRISSECVPRALDLDRTRERPMLVLERVPGVTLARLLDDGPLDLKRWLCLATQLARALADVHDARIIHKDLKPRNVLVEPRSGRAWIIDFGLASELGAALDVRPGNVVEGTLHYMAPEQTGWIKRGCDFKSDLYSLGATLYHAWTGAPPFNASSVAKLVHEHVARAPTAPTELRAGLPAALSALLVKLLSKEPEERYSSARALASDLERCQAELERVGVIGDDFQLTADQAPARPRFTARLYGREREITTLREAFAHALEGLPRAVMIIGTPGVGKTALVHELAPLVAESGGHLVSGKFDPYRDRPYSGWVMALGALVDRMLVESEERLLRWSEALREGLGPIARAMIDLVPDLGFILGEVPRVPALGPRETQARLSLALQRFLQVCATPEHPLVVFLDDLQWSDAGSRSLLEDLLSSKPRCALLLIGAHRDSDVDPDHPVALLIAKLAKLGAPIEALRLEPLPRQEAVEMLSAALERSPADVAPLAELIERKTANNPLLVRHFVEHVFEQGLLRFERPAGWCWDPAALAASDIPDGAVALMTAKIERLDSEARSVLQLASCVGDEFDAELLAELGRERTDLGASLQALCDAGLISPSPNGFRFAHERIREAAQSLLSDSARSQLHFRMARFLLDRHAPEERAEHVFEIVEHLNRSLEHVREELRPTAIDLNVFATQVALAAGAPGSAVSLISAAQRLFLQSDWKDAQERCFELHLESAEVAFQNGKLDETLTWLDSLEAHVSSQTEFMQLETKRIKVLALLRSPEESARHALSVLRRLGVSLPLHPSRLRATLAIYMMEWRIRMRRNPWWRTVKPDPMRIRTLAYMGACAGVFARVDVHLSMLSTCFAVQHNLRYGYAGGVAFSLAAFAFYHYDVTCNAKVAKRFLESIETLDAMLDEPYYAPRTTLQQHIVLEPWLMRRRQALASADGIVRKTREIGDVEFEYYVRLVLEELRVLGGAPVVESDRRLRELADDVTRSRHLYPAPEALHGVYRLLLTENVTREALERQRIESARAIEGYTGSGDVYVRTLWVMVLCVYGYHDLALAESEALGARLFSVVPYLHVADHLFFRGVSAAALAEREEGGARRRNRRILNASLRRLRRWARNGPDFVHMVMLLDAERARLRGDRTRARKLYEDAAQRALRHDYVHHAALAHERRASMLALQRRDTESAAARQAAIELYRKWGALSKAAALRAGEDPLGSS